MGGLRGFGLRKQFFSEEKNQKTFALDAIPDLPAMVRTYVQAQGQKSFGSFLQKRTFFLLNALISLDFFSDGHLELLL
jgi:hypothetical protein